METLPREIESHSRLQCFPCGLESKRRCQAPRSDSGQPFRCVVHLDAASVVGNLGPVLAVPRPAAFATTKDCAPPFRWVSGRPGHDTTPGRAEKMASARELLVGSK